MALQKLMPSHRQRQLAAKFRVGQDGILEAGSLEFGSLKMTEDTTAPPSESEDQTHCHRTGRTGAKVSAVVDDRMNQ